MAMNWGEKAFELIKELERNPDTVPPYNEDVVRAVGVEVAALVGGNQADVAAIVAGTAALNAAAAVKLRHAAIERNRRCLSAYTHERMKRLKGLRWSSGAVLPPHIRANLSPSELDWWVGYCGALGNYMGALGEAGMDLTALATPPKSLLYEVRCLSDYGPYEISSGTTLILSKNSLHTLPRADCEPLIRQGVLSAVGFG